MKEWLVNIKAPKFLRYLFFVTYTFYRRFTNERSDAHHTAILFLSIGMLFLITILIEKTLFILGVIKHILVFSLLIGVQYIFFYLDEKWKLYLEEFSSIKRKQQLIGGIYLFIYFAISICMAFKL